MIYHLAARALIMVGDHEIELAEAIAWVTRRIHRNLQRYYRLRLYALLIQEVY